MAQTRVSAYPATTSNEQPSKQEQLNNWCFSKGITPQYQVMTDRRGGRTAWSCAVVIGNSRVTARFWYDGQFVNSAKEDAAEVALMQLNIIPRRGWFRYLSYPATDELLQRKFEGPLSLTKRNL